MSTGLGAEYVLDSNLSILDPETILHNLEVVGAQQIETLPNGHIKCVFSGRLPRWAKAHFKVIQCRSISLAPERLSDDDVANDLT